MWFIAAAPIHSRMTFSCRSFPVAEGRSKKIFLRRSKNDDGSTIKRSVVTPRCNNSNNKRSVKRSSSSKGGSFENSIVFSLACLEELTKVEMKRDTPKLIDLWMEKYTEALEWKLANEGSLTIKKTDDKVPLARWITYQRKLAREDKLTPEKYEALNALGMFDVKRRSKGEENNDRSNDGTKKKKKQNQRPKQSWEQTFEELILFKEINGDGTKNQLPIKLKRWLNAQKNTKSMEKRQLLIDNGFEEYVNPKKNARRRASWDTRFTELRQFQREHDHCNVPATYRLNRPLGYWVATQRKTHRNGTLKPEREEALTNLGFEFEPLKTWYRNGPRNVDELAGKVSVSWMGRAAPAYEEKQKLVFESLQENFREFDMRFNHRLGRLGSIKPDIVIEVNNWAMIIEVDEFQHKKYERDGEDDRLEQLRDYFNIPLKVVRFNPDPCSMKDERDFEERLEVLKEHVRNSIEVAPIRDVEIDYVCF